MARYVSSQMKHCIAVLYCLYRLYCCGMCLTTDSGHRFNSFVIVFEVPDESRLRYM